jgi:anthranilate phosphoribosyltransferase
MLKDGSITESIVTPSMVGLTAVESDRLRGGDAVENARIFTNVLEGSDRGPVRDLALINAAAGLLVAGAAPSLREGFRIAQEAIETGRTLDIFERYREEATREAKRSAP